MAKMGRPAVAKRDYRGEYLTVRLRPAEKRAVVQAARKAGCRHTDWARSVLLESCAGQTDAPSSKAGADWENLTLPEFIACHCAKPLSKPLRAIANGARGSGAARRTMGQLVSESDVHRLPGVGPQTATVIMRAMRRLGWSPGLTSLDISCAFGSAADCLIKVAAKVRRLGKAHPGLAEELASLSAQASEKAAVLREVRRRLSEL